MHGTDAALNAARAFRIAGVNARPPTSLPERGLRHSRSRNIWPTATSRPTEDEAAAFRAFADLYPDTVLLVDTYDTLAGVEKVIDARKAVG